MTGKVKGWCPGALRPMPSGDGLVLRIRPHASRLAMEQARAIADLAAAHGSGLIDLGTRAHVQLRGIRSESLPAVQRALAGLGLIDPDPAVEARRNILTSPVWQDDAVPRLVAALEEALADGPVLPPKFGFAVDAGPVAVLGGASADIRIERAAGGGLILRAEGMALGEDISPDAAAERALALAVWFSRHADGATRMAQLIARGGRPPLAPLLPPRTGPALHPGPTPQGLCLALPFGRMRAGTLRALAVAPLRLTPWRSVVLEGVAAFTPSPALIADPNDPLLRVVACTGAPGCASAAVETRALARRLAPLVPPDALLHVSGCAKGCAHRGPAPLTLTGRDGRFDLIMNAAADAEPARRGLLPDDIPDLLRDHLAPRL